MMCHYGVLLVRHPVYCSSHHKIIYHRLHFRNVGLLNETSHCSLKCKNMKFLVDSFHPDSKVIVVCMRKEIFADQPELAKISYF